MGEPSQRGRFITFEGGEGSGKSTQARLLAAGLSAGGRDVVLTREPGGAPGAEVLRRLLLEGAHEFAPVTETMLHFAARAEHVARTIEPALSQGTWVVSDRFTDSTRAYQGAGLGVDDRTIDSLDGLIGLAPDLTIVLTVPAELSVRRLAARGNALDRYERLGADFHARVDRRFCALAAMQPERCVLLDGSGEEAEIGRAILDLVRARL